MLLTAGLLLFGAFFCSIPSAIGFNASSYFYIYDWTKEFGDVYPPPNAILHPESPYSHTFHGNNGIGTAVAPDVGLFQTWQFSMYKNVMQRLMVSKHRTRDPSKATAFIIPFDAGVHSYIDQKDGKYRLGSPYGWSVIRWLQEASKSDVLWKYRGHDHFVFFGLTEFTMTGIAQKEFFKGICQNCTVLTVEATPTRTATLYHRSHKYWYAIPYPSSFHWNEQVKELPWKRNRDKSPQRDILTLFIGSVKTRNAAANVFRRALKSQCDSEKEVGVCHWHNTSHSCDGVINATDQMLLFKRARFCLAPPGDTVSRKSLFDALVTGCVPVLFATFSLSQYAWYLSETEIEEVSVYIPIESILDHNVNFLDVLRAISHAELRRKQLAIEKIASRLQYSIVPQYISDRVNVSASSGVVSYGSDEQLVWDSPVYDAVDVLVGRMLNQSTIQPVYGFTVEERRYHKCLQHDLIKHHREYGGLFKSGTAALTSGRLWKNIKCPPYEFGNSNLSINAIWERAVFRS